ncbi:hypothetical protein CYMTET_56306, partial [Cymbomonas tetramitiformis]
VGLAFAVSETEGVYVPLRHLDAPDQLEPELVMQKLRLLLEDPSVKITTHNAKRLRNALSDSGIALGGVKWDIALEAYALNTTHVAHDLESVIHRHLGVEVTSYEAVAGKGAKEVAFSKVPLQLARQYAVERAVAMVRVRRALHQKLNGATQLLGLYCTLDRPLINVLATMESHGILVDPVLLAAHSDALAAQLKCLEVEAFSLAKEPFNLASPKQIAAILFDKLELPVLSKTPTGAASTGEAVLAKLAKVHPLPQLLLEHRTISKLKSTYTNKLLATIHPRSGRVHATFHQDRTSTGRLSCSDPNLQSIPVRSPEGRAIRRAFVAPPGAKILAADYSQIELRIMAHMAQDPGLLRAFALGQDIHASTAAEVFYGAGTTADQVSAEDRRRAKAINFGIIYGMSAYGLSQALDVEVSEARQYIEAYFERYPGVSQFMQRTVEQAQGDGFVETMRGRRLYIPGIHDASKQRQKAAQRVAVNAPVQGTAADIIKTAMVEVDGWLRESKVDARLVMQVHDELVFEVEESCVEEVKKSVIDIMSSAANLEIPLVVNTGVGDNWEEAH